MRPPQQLLSEQITMNVGGVTVVTTQCDQDTDLKMSKRNEFEMTKRLEPYAAFS